jgi:hypothetical protein
MLARIAATFDLTLVTSDQDTNLIESQESGALLAIHHLQRK